MDGGGGSRLLPMHTGGRVAKSARGAGLPDYMRQWPGSYFEAAFRGSDVRFRIGPGRVALHLFVDDRPSVALMGPQPGWFRIAGLSAGSHRVRLQVVSEGQDTSSSFGGFYAGTGTVPVRFARRDRQIEFIGDSFTVGYGNTSATRVCTPEAIWATTDTNQGPAGRLARRYRADWQANAISGRGVVRNYAGHAAETLLAVYPFVLFGKAKRYADPTWQPQVIVISLGTNDFSTPLAPGEPWTSRAALQADYEARYLQFLRELRALHPRALFVLWATDTAGGEVAAESARVVESFRASGDRRIGFVEVMGLAFSGCDGHPSIDDGRVVADRIGRVIDGFADAWHLPRMPKGK